MSNRTIALVVLWLSMLCFFIDDPALAVVGFFMYLLLKDEPDEL